MIKKICPICNKEFSTYPSFIKNKKGKFCSTICCYKSLKGRKLSKECIEKMKLRKKEKAAHWKGGKTIKSGRVFIFKPEHPFANQRGYIRNSHLVMEKTIGRYLKPEEIVHHINSIKDDDRPENLRLFKDNSEHMKLHRNNLGQFI